MQNSKSPRSTSTLSPNSEPESRSEAESLFGVPFTPMAEESSAQPGYESAEPQIVQGPLPGTAPRPGKPDEAHRPYKFDAARYRRIVFFFVLLVIRVVFWEVVAKR